MQYIIDRSGSLGKHRRTATGGFIVDATLARVGVLEYRVDGTVIRHFNPPEVLTKSLEGVATAPVTNRHPARFVDTETYQKVAAGHVVGAPTFEGGHIKATLAIHDARLIEDIEHGVVSEVSMGYAVSAREAPGVAEDGETYDLVRERIEWNHIAVVPMGRAGKSVRLLLDSQDIPAEEGPMAYMIDGVEFEAEQAQAAFDAAVGRLEGSLAATTKSLQAAAARAEKAEAELAVALSDEAIDAAVAAKQARVAAEAEKQAKLDAVKEAFPSIQFDGKSDDYIDGMHQALEAAKEADPEGLAGLKTKIDAADLRPQAPKPSARDVMIANNRRLLMGAP